MKAFGRRWFVLGLLAVVVACCLTALPCLAAVYYWDTNGSTAGAGDAPTGTWGTGNWNTDSSGATTLFSHTTTSDDDLYFVAGPAANSGENAYAITVSGTQAANSLTFQSSGAAALAGGTVNLSDGGITVSQYAYGSTPQGAVTISAPVALQASQTWTNNSANNLTILGSVANGSNTLTIAGAGSTVVLGTIGSGSGGLTKTGSGVLTLQGANGFSGATTITGGTLSLANGSALQGSTLVAPTTGGIVFDQGVSNRVFNFGGISGSGNLVLQNNASSPAAVTLIVGGNNGSTAYSGAMSGSGSLTKVGGGTLVVSGSNTYTGGTTVSAGTLKAANFGSLAGYSTASKITVNDGATLALGVGGSGWDASKVYDLLAANYDGFSPGSALAIDTANAGTGGFSYGTAITGNMGLTKLGANSMTLTAANTYTGPTTVSGGTLQLGDATSGHDGSLASTSIVNNSALVYNLYGSQSYSGVISGFGTLTKSGGGALILKGANTYSGLTTISGGTLQFGDGTSGHDGSLSSTTGIVNNSALIYNLAGSQGYAGNISGTGSLTKTGGGALTLSGTNNTYSGGTTVSGGTLAVTNPAALSGRASANKVTVNNTATLALNVGDLGWDASSVDSLLSANGSGFSSGSFLGIDTSNVGAGGFSYGSNITAQYMGLKKLGANTLTLSGTNSTYGGGTVVAGGTLAVTNVGALPGYNVGSKVAVSSGATLTLKSWSATNVHDLLSYNTGGFATGSTLGIDTTSAGLSYGNTISGNMGLTKLGPNTLTLSVANTFTGPTTISGGTLNLSHSNALQASTLAGPTAGSIVFDSSVSSHAFTLGGLSGAGSINLQDSASTAIALTVGGNNASTAYSGSLGGSGSLVKTSTGTLALIGSNTFTGGTTISGGTLQLGSGISGQDGSLSASGGIANNAALVYNLAGSKEYAGTISGTGSLTKTGVGTLTLSGTNNSYTGGTTVSAGTLTLTSPGALAHYDLANKVTVNSAATLALSVGDSGWGAGNVGSLLSANGSGFSTGSFLGIDTGNVGAGGFTYGSNITAQYMGLKKLGANTLTLSGTNTYSGGTVVAGGALAVTSTTALPGYASANKVTVNSGATLVLGIGSSWNATSVGSLLTANGSGFASGSALGIDTTTASLSYTTAIAGSMGLTKLGSNTLTLSVANTFVGPTTVSGGTLSLSHGRALQASTLIAPTTGIGTVAFDSSVSPASFTLGGLSGSGNLALQNTGSAAVALNVGGNNGNTSYSGALSGPGSFTKSGLGTLTYTGTGTYSGGTTLNGGALVVASSGSLTSTTGKLYVGGTGPAAMMIQDSASITVSELDVNYLNTNYGGSALTLTSGSLTVNGPTYVGRAAMRTDPSILSAAVYQNGGTASLTGLLTVGFAGTATSLYDIDGGTLNANGGILVGGNPANSQGNGIVNIDGGTVNVYGTGLVVGQDSGLTTSGYMSLSAGTLNVGSATYPASLTLGSKGGLATFDRSGGSMYVKSDLQVGGIGTLILDARGGASVATSFGHTLTRLSSAGAPAPGLLLVVPYTGDLGDKEAVSFGTVPATTNGIIGPWAVTVASAASTSGDFLGVSTNKLAAFPESGSGPHYNDGFSGASGTSVVSVSSTSSTKSTNTATIYAMKVSDTATINTDETLTISSGGLILNGGTVAGGVLAFGSQPLVFAGSSNPGTISSAIKTSSGLVKWGPGNLVLSGDNSALTGGIVVGTGTLNIQDTYSLGPGGPGNGTIVATGASLEMEGGIRVDNVPISINGAGVGGLGAIRNVSGDNELAGSVTLGSAAQINVDSDEDTLTLSGPIHNDTSAVLTKAGIGTLRLTADSTGTLYGPVVVAEGVLAVQHSGALGAASTSRAVTVQDGATLALQGGISVPAIPLSISGAGTGNGALQSDDNNTFAGPVILAADSQVNVDSGSLSLAGVISGGYALTKAGSGTLALSGSNSFTGPLYVVSGSVSIASINSAGSNGPLGTGGAPVVLGSNGNLAVLEYTAASSPSTDRAFTLDSGGTGSFRINESAANLTLTGIIDGSGSLQKTGSGTLTLAGANTYTGTTTINDGTLAIGTTGTINASSGLAVGPGTLRVTAGTGNQLPDSGSVTFTGGSLDFIGSGSNPGETAGNLVLAAGQNSIAASRGSGSTYAPYLRFASGPGPHATGVTVSYYSDANSSIQFGANPPEVVNGILGGYAFFSDGTTAHADFATRLAGSPDTISPLPLASYTDDDLGTLGTNGTLNLRPTVSQTAIPADKTFNSLNLTGSIGVTINSSQTLTVASGGLIGNTSGTISGGGTLKAGNGELVVYAAQGLTIDTAIDAATALVKTGPANLKLTSTSAIVGNIYLNQGTLEYAPTGSASYGGIISGRGSLLKSGGAALTLTGNNTYTGATTITGGALYVNGSLASGSAVSLQNALLGGSGTIGGNVTVSSGGTIAFGATSGSVTGSVTVASGTLTVGQTGSEYLRTTGGLIVGGNASFTAYSTSAHINGSVKYTSTSNSTFAGIIEGSNKTVTLSPSSGIPTLILSGSNTYTGGTIIEGGTLKLGDTDALGTGGVWLSGGKLDLNHLDVTLASLAGTGGEVSTSTGTSELTVNPANGVSTEYAGTIADGGTNNVVSLVKEGDGTLTLSGSNSYTGGTVVTGGVLVISNVNALPAGTSLTVGSSGVVVFSSGFTGAIEMSGLSIEGFGSSAPASASRPLADQIAPASVQNSPSAVPEPGTLGLLFAGLGITGLLAVRRLVRSRRHVS